ncbi:T9SS type B sorting domain-containing protein [Aestuariibaculum sediminum]|uniref:T9SS type B sorting domain-containing protein n=1 Tax=Aestuariibaculum sediminum TaxID=2770637 RepID=A0A8J6U7J3_9FLAO|nr:T9SS type B sorting domain-containing protein [Aestuariibaculum sediminum]MBD0832063.1 T9SS type B sorting domain-containing protein [Aestuariibaculum sediminum]
MPLKTNFKIITIILTLCFSVKAFSQLSKTHYIPPLTSAEFGNANPEEQYIYISTPNNANINYTIKPVGQTTTNYITGTVSKTSPREIFIGSGNGQLFVASSQTSNIHSNKGYIIEADDPIYVSVRMNAGGGAQAGALVSKGSAALGKTFRVGSFTNENPQSNYLNFVSVMATEDDTQITFDDLPSGLNVENYSGTFPINTTLNKGESYIVATNSANSSINRDGLIGTLITSTKNIVVNCGSANGSFHNGNGRDYGIDQIVDLSKIGSEYIFVKGSGNNEWENILVVAHSNNTAIYINGNATPIATINAGQYYLIEGNYYNSNGNMYLETSQPVFVYQGIGATTSEANQGMFFVPPLSCEARGNLDNIAFIENIGSTTYSGGVSIVTKLGATVTVNGNPISVSPNSVTGNPDYVTYKILGLSGNVSVESTDELYCAYFNYNGAATSGSFYSGFPSPPEINFNIDLNPLGICIPNVRLEVANLGNFDSIEWFYNDGSGYISTGSQSLEYTPTQSGTYKLVGVLTCSNLTLESVEVPVSICPDDIDNDGIIDNIDIDNDNDGILNCTESYGDQPLDLTNILSGSTSVGNYTFNGTVTTEGNTSLTPVSGTSDGTIISETPNKNGTSETSVNYQLNFNKNIHLKVEYPSSTPSGNGTLTGDQSFIIRVPNTRTITLLDLDDQLLIDTNFDGIYESNVTQISAYEIRFKIKSNTLAFGQGTFGFYANNIDALTVIHRNNSETGGNYAAFSITATCIDKDTDGDNVPDALDLDSDNDGVPDSVENTGILIPLSYIDNDLNGLDDSYNIASLPMDTDNDGVPDYYDLDSDNDGIFDLTETGALGTFLSDTDINGVIDNGSSFGTNGLLDFAETSPDSGITTYVLDDLDNDTIFSYIDYDSDGDGCNDVIEAGFSDANNDNYLGDSPTLITNNNGVVTNASGYTLPLQNYNIPAPIIITAQPINTEVCNTYNTEITITANADSYQWEVSNDGTNWLNITDNANYNGAQTANLMILNAPINSNNYQFRVLLNKTGNSCGLYSDVALLTVHTLPLINTPVTLIQCDDDTDGISFFNLTEVNFEISANASNEKFSYFTSQTSAESGDINSSDFIETPTAYQNANNPYNDTVWARVENEFGCPSVAQIQLSVGVSQIPNGAINEILTACDDFLDINGIDNINNDNRDGIASFDFSYVKTMVENLFTPQTPEINFYRNEADALAEQNAIINTANYRNIGYPGTQNIYIRVDSPVSNDCQALGPYITLVVEELPVVNSVSIPRVCDDDFDGAYPFDVSTVENIVLGNQSLNDISIDYFDASGNPLNDFNGSPVTSPLPNILLMDNQTITIRLTNKTPNACYAETTLDFVVDQQPVAHPVATQIFCDDGSDGTAINDGLHTFDTSTFSNTILGNQSNMEIYFSYDDIDGNTISDATTLPNPWVSDSQTINVNVINPLNTSCVATTTIDLVVNPIPEFYINEEEIVCTSDPSFTVTLAPVQDNANEVLEYTWFDENGNQISNETTLDVSTPGNYSVTLTNPATLCSTTKSVIVKASELATITQDDITVVDISDHNSVTINNPSSLGSGTYQFALESKDGLVIFPYQDQPVFNNVRAGDYTLFVKDDICGIAELDVFVIGYRKFFTPNGDGQNDYWKIQGLDQSQTTSMVYIYDRYGKLIKQLDPLGIGWDGTFKGKVLSSDDYWFKVQLTDGRTFMGHFTLKR